MKEMPAAPPLIQKWSLEKKPQVLFTHVVHVGSHKNLLTIIEPLQLTIEAHLQNEATDQLDLGLHMHFNILHTRGFEPTAIVVDPQDGSHMLIGNSPVCT